MPAENSSPARRASREPAVKYFSIFHGAALMVGTHPGPHGDDLGRTWKQLNKTGRMLPANDMAARYFLFGEAGCQQIGAREAARMAAEFGGTLQMLITGETWRCPEPRNVIHPQTTQALLRRGTAKRPRRTPRT